MANLSTDRHDLGDLGGTPNQTTTSYNFNFPYEDPAILNPDELATFPKTGCPSHNGTYPHHETHLVNRKFPLRDGRITITDNHLE